VLVMETEDEGSTPPCVARKDSDGGDTESAGGVRIASETGSVIGALPPEPLMVTCPEYEPTPSPAMCTLTLAEEGASPAAGVTLSQEASVLAVQESGSSTASLMESVAGAGSLAPCCAAK